MSNWRFWIVDTRTGVKQLEVFPAAGSWSRVLNGSGQGEHTFVLPAARLEPTDPAYEPMVDKALSRLWARTLVVCRVVSGAAFGVLPPVVFAGLIVKRKYTAAGNRLTLTEFDVRTLLARRYPFGATSYWADEPNHVPGRLVCTNLSYRSIISRLMGASLVGPTDIYSLPIVLPTASEAGGNSRTYENYNFTTTEAAIEDIQNSEDGPDVDFEPRWNGSGNLEWLLRVGTPAQPTLVGDLFEFNMSVPEPRLLGLSKTEDGRDQMTGVFSVGDGSEVDMKVGGYGTGLASVIPALDVVETHKDESDQNVLAGYSVAAIAAMGQATTQYEFSMLAGEEPGVVPLASIFRLMWSGDPWIDDGNVDLRLVSLSGDMSETLTVDMQPVGA